MSAQNQYNNKIVFGNTVLIDLTGDDINPSRVLFGYKAHDKSGAQITGNCTFDSDTTDATANDSEILDTKTAYVGGQKVTGSMPNRGGVSGIIDDVNGEYNIQSGYHDGSGVVQIDSVEKSKIIPGNIKSGVELLGVTGTYTGEGVTAQSKTVTPYTTQQVFIPDSGYDYLSQVTVEAISFVETDNAAGGKTVTIGTVAV